MSDEIQQLSPETSQTEPVPTQSENQVSELSPDSASPDEPIGQSLSQSEVSATPEMPSGATQPSPSPEEAAPVKDANSANEPLESVPTPEIPNEPNNPNITVEKHGNDTTITEVMEQPETPTAQMAGDEPFEKTPDSAKATPGEQDKPIDLVEELKAKQREENLKLANETRQEKKQEKIGKILGLFSEKSEITNDEVEKLLHVSDATATRYLETLEKEGKIKQVGKTGKGVGYIKI